MPNKKHIKDLFTPSGLFNLAINLIKDLKNDYMQILISQESVQYLESQKQSLNDLHKLTDEQLRAFKDTLISSPGHFVYRKLQNPDYSHHYLDFELLKSLLFVVVDIMAKKLPADVVLNNQKLESVIHKIKLVAVPKNVVTDTNEQFAKNTGERAVVRIRIPRKTVQEEEDYVHPVTCLEEKRIIERTVEIEIDDKVLLVPARVDLAAYSIYTINESAGKWQRKEVFNNLKKNYAEYFEGKDIQKECDQMNVRCEEIAQIIENNFIQDTVNDDSFPLFDFEINLNDTD